MFDPNLPIFKFRNFDRLIHDIWKLGEFVHGANEEPFLASEIHLKMRIEANEPVMCCLF